MTIRETISQVKGEIKETNADSRLTNKAVYNKLVRKAMLLIQRESDSLKLAHILELYQTVKCLKIEEAPAIDPCCGIKSKAVVYRTINKLPEMYSDGNGPIVDTIESIDGYSDIKLTNPGTIKRIKEESTNSKYDKTIYAFIFDGYLYLLKKHPVRMTAAFISDVSGYNDCSCDDKPCIKFLDTQWKIPKKILDATIQLVIQDYMKDYKQIREDLTTNKNSNT